MTTHRSGHSFQPSHRITLVSGEVTEVMLTDGAAYTREEWESETQADYERGEGGAWTFQGQPFAGTVGEIGNLTDQQRCEAGAGLHYRSREWDEMFHGGGWDGAWPEIDRHGRLTGRIVGSEDGYLNVNDEAMISLAEARAGGWERPDDGYAEPPQRWPTIRNCNLSSRHDDRGQHVWEAVLAAGRGCVDCDLISALDDLEAALARHAESDSAEAEEACAEAEEAVEAALLAINAAFDSDD